MLRFCRLTQHFTILLLGLSLAACNVETKLRNKHEPFDPKRGQIKADTTPEVQNKNLNTIDITAIIEMQSSLNSPEDHYQKIVKTYESIVLDKERIESATFSPNDKIVRLLDIFNQSLLVVLNENKKFDGLEEILSKYINLAYSWCDEKLDSCHNIKYFYRSSLSATVMQAMAKTQTDTASYYKYLQMSFLLKNHSLDSELRTLYLIRSKELLSIKDKIDPTLYERHVQALSLILGEEMSQPNDPRLKAFFDQEDAYNLKISINSDIARSVLFKAFSNYLYDCDENSTCSTLSESFKKSLAARIHANLSNSPSNNIFDRSFKQIVDHFGSGSGNEISRNLGLDLHLDSDEYLYIIDGLIREDFSAEFASRLYRSTRQDDQRMLSHTMKYTKILLAQMILLTKEYMLKVYTETKDFDPKRTVIYAIEQSIELSNQWSDLISRIEVIRNFISQNLRAHSQFEETEKMLLTVSKNIKYMVVYPHMMMLAYQLEDQDIGDIDISIRGNKFTIPTKLIIHAFFDRGFPPWFDFVNDRIPLKKHQLIYAFYYALETSTLSTSAESNDSNNNEFGFLRTVMGKYLQKDIKKLTTEIDNNEFHLRKSKYADMKRACAEIKSISSKPLLSDEWLEEVGTYPLAKVNLSFSDLTQTTFLGPMSLHTKDGLVSHSLDHLKGMGGLLHKIRNEIMPNLSFVRSLYEVLKLKHNISDIKSVNCSSPSNDIQREVCELEKFISEKEDYIRRIWGYSIDWQNNFGTCLKAVHQIERLRQNSLLEKEKEFLAKVHTWMSLIKDYGPNAKIRSIKEQLSGNNDDRINSLIEFGTRSDEEPLLQTLNSSFKIADDRLPVLHKSTGTRPFSGLDQITVNSQGNVHRAVFRYSNIDIFFRLREYLLDQDSGIAPEMIITPVNDLRSLGVAYKEEKSSRVPYTNSLETFLSQAMSSLNGMGDSKLDWITRSDPTNFIKAHNNLMIELLLINGKESLHCSARTPQARDMHPGTEYKPEPVETSAGKDLESEVIAEDAPAEETTVELDYISWRNCLTERRKINFSANEIVENVISSAQMVHIKDSDTENLRLMGRDELYNEIFMRGLFIDRDDSTQAWSFLKPIFKILSENSTNSDWTKDALYQPYEYFKNQRNLGYFIFEIDPSSKKMVSCEYKKYVDIYEQALNSLAEAANRFTERDKDNANKSIRYTLDRTTTSRDRRNVFSYLGTEDIDAHKDRMREFHGRETQGFYSNQEDCPEGGL